MAGRDRGRQEIGDGLIDEGGLADTAGTLEKEDLPLGGKVLCDMLIVNPADGPNQVGWDCSRDPTS